MTERYVCIHGHFYQPPRENPWLEEVELQDSAYPYHDWNVRITEECYRKNATSRILDPNRRIIDIVNNYTKMSFNFGPTLLSWLERHETHVYEAILEADQQSQDRFGGHGAALAQCYNHMIMPLATRQDKRTQVLWGIRDFTQRFGRRPEGMWLPETAVDIETLEVLAEHGILFTILAPHQAKSVRPLGAEDWQPVEKGAVDTTQAYCCPLPSGGSINLFFYHGDTAQNVAFGRYIQNGELLAEKLLWILHDKKDGPCLAHIATDGETFGHHHRHSDMALAFCMHHIEAHQQAQITIYGQYLELFPPTQEVEIYQNSSWSCSHGVERWRSDCGCAMGTYPQGNQQWRKPLRDAMDWLRDQLATVYEHRMKQYCDDPWSLRNEYISVVLNRSLDTIEDFLALHVDRASLYSDKVIILKLLELQRHAMLMFTSCGWFFDELSGIEGVQVLQYAARAMQLAREVDGKDLESGFEEHLAQATSNVREFQNGKQIYRKLVKPNAVDLNRVGGHLAMTSLFEEDPETLALYCYDAQIEDYERHSAGIQILATGRATITSDIVLEKHAVDFAVLHLGDRNIIGAVNARLDDTNYQSMCQALKTAFERGDTTELMRLLTVAFGGNSYSLWHLFKDQQRRILFQLLGSTWMEIEASFRRIYEHNYTVMQLMRGVNMPLPKALAAPTEVVLNEDLRRVISAEEIDVHRLYDLVDQAERLDLQLDTQTLQFEAGHKINYLMCRLEDNPNDLETLEILEITLRLILTVVQDIEVQTAQNILFGLSKKVYPKKKKRAATNEKDHAWVTLFEALGQHLGVMVGESDNDEGDSTD